MAAQPKKKISRVRGRTRRAHNKIVLPKLSNCPKCRALIPPHIACPECGFYGSKKILITKTDKHIDQKLKEEKKTASKPKPSPKPAKDTKSQESQDSSLRAGDPKGPEATSPPAGGRDTKENKK